MNRSVFTLVLGAILGFAPVATVLGQPKAVARSPLVLAQPSERPITQLIVRYRSDEVRTFSAAAGRTKLASLATRSNVKLAYVRPMSGLSHVIRLAEPMPRAEAFALAKRLEMDPSVEFVEIDEVARPAFVPNDFWYSSRQWHYHAPNVAVGNAGGIALPDAWSTARGAGVTVAVVDTGIVSHPDLTPNVVGGYDLISDPFRSNDGDGRDSDATDPGDWVVAGYCGFGELAENSSWHGSHVAGTVAAVTNNGVFGAGVAFNARVLPVRVLGRCGGDTSDIADGIRWAAGASVPGVPNNTNPAQVINLSLTTQVAGPCPATYQSAINDARAVGAIVVVATGNDDEVAIRSPANCAGVIAVTAHTFQGDSADYANVGPGTALSAPGGGACFTPDGGGFVCSTRSAASVNWGVWSTVLFGPTTATSADPNGNSGPAIGPQQGTSMAAPHVAGVAALLLSRMPTLTANEVRFLLTSSTRPFPSGLYCARQLDARCGSGLLDAKAALDRLADRTPAVSIIAPSVVGGSQVGTLHAVANARNAGSTAFQFAWRQLAGPAVALTGATSAAASFVGTNPGGTHTFEVRVTDGNGYAVTQTVSVRSNNPPVMNALPAQTVMQGNSLSFSVSATDPENDTITYVATNLPPGSTFAAATGQFSWPNVAAAAGTYSFTVMATDGTVNSTPVTVNINVTTPPPPPPPAGGGGGAFAPPVATAFGLLVALALRRRLERVLGARA
jgi:serine protease